MAAADVDVGYVAGHLGLEQPVLAALTTEPTIDLVAVLLRAVTLKAHEFDALYADKLQADIELENAVRSAENRSQTFKTTANNALSELKNARKTLEAKETRCQSLENELQVLRARSEDHVAEAKTLSDKIKTLQASNRTNLSIIESNTKRDQTVADELAKQHQRNVDLSRQIVVLQQSDQNAKGQLSSAKYREESLKQQLELALRNTEWLESELKTKGDEALKYRKEKGARIAQLQRENEDAQYQIDALRRTEQQLRERLEVMQVKTDETLVKLQKQEAAFATTVDSYKKELEDQRRLVDMSDQLSKKHRERVRELEAEKERLKDNYESEIRRVRLELEQEKQTTGALEEKIQQLEAELDQIRARLEGANQSGSAPQTPRPNGSVIGRAASPFGTPGSIRSKAAITATQAIEQLYQVKGQLASEKRRSQQLTEELDGMMSALEAKAPEIQELQAEAETLRNEIARMSELSQQSFEERDTAKKAARKAESALANSQSEIAVLKKQLRDLGTQIQILVFSIYAFEKGVEQLTEEEKFRLQQLERGEITEEALSDMSDTHQFITQKLVVFKDIKSMQAQNEELLRITRELAEQMESEEALAAKHQAKQDHDRAEKLEQDLAHMTEENRSMKNTMESYKTERDMFRRVLQQRSGGEEASTRSSFPDGSQRLPLSSIEDDQSEALSEALRKLQSEYDNFRDVQNDVRKDLRDQIDHLSTERSSLQAERVKLQGDLRIESERREMLQSNYFALQSENAELQKRSYSLSEMAAKQDMRTQQVAEELVETKGLLDSMRNETANLKAEKRLWKDIQDRMSRDNENLIEEKNRLNHLLATQQSLENERSLMESEAQRKVQEKMENMERELQDVLRKLSNEVEECKYLQLRKEYEAREAQKRIDELLSNLSQVREEHISIKTTKEYLQARVDELTVELRNAEDRVGRLQPRPTPRPGPTQDNYQQLQVLEYEIQDLHTEISDLKRDLDLANTKLDNAKTEAEQYKALSSANEETLEDFRASQGQYKQEIELLIEEKEVLIKDLEQRVKDVSEELSRSNNELSALRDSQSDVARRCNDEKAILQEQLDNLKEESARHLEAACYHQQDLRAQAEIASKAQQDYEQELVKHAAAAKLTQQLRGELNEVKSQIISLKAEAESAKVALAQNENSWEEQRQELERELADVVARREDANAQNKLLHQQLEGLSAQVVALQKKRRATETDSEVMSPVPVGDSLDGLRELNSYLRREKEILEVQYDVKSQESRRLQQAMSYLQSQLDEAHLKLDQERAHSTRGERTSMTHQDLMGKLNELNLYRESSATLRNENSKLKELVAERNSKIEEIEGKVQPLEAKIETLNISKAYFEEEIKQVQEDRDRWQKRTEGILTKYGRVDPAEIESLKKNIEDLQLERDSFKESTESIQAQVAELELTLETEREAWQNTRAKLTEQFKERSKRLTGEKNELVQRSSQLQEQLHQVNSELEGTQKRAEETALGKAEIEKELQSFKQQVQELRQNIQQRQQVQQAQQTSSAPNEVALQLEQRLTDVSKELEAVTAQKLGAEERLDHLQTELQRAIFERDEAVRKLQDAVIKPMEVTQEIQSAPVQEVDGATQHGGPSNLSEEARASLEEKVVVSEAKAADLEEKVNQVQQAAKERCDKMRDSLNNKLKESRTKFDEEFKQREEDLLLKFEQEKRTWETENPRVVSAVSEPALATPVRDSLGQNQSSQGPSTTGFLPELAQLDDAGIRQFLASNSTVKSIIAANLKKRLETESAKIKGEMETKIASAREQAQLMESKKSTLRINMAENKLKTANAKLSVVETAASETPTRAVVEVWDEVRKVTGPGGAVPATTGRAVLASSATLQDAQKNSKSETMDTIKQREGNNIKTELTSTTQQHTSATPVSKSSNPFAASVKAGKMEGPKESTTNVPNLALPQPPPQAAMGGPRSSGIPMPRGGGRGRGNAYAQSGQRAGSGNQEGGSSPAGRGRSRGGGNSGAAEFQPGTKRPRGESEAGRGAKRARGGL